jgi:hypothetical protein
MVSLGDLELRNVLNGEVINNKKINLALCLIKYYTMKMYGGVDV